jgi:alanyl-tRNA synthetase
MFDQIDFGCTLPPTDKLFHRDSSQSRATAEVLFVRDEFVVLNQSIFYAESGGQMPDRGTIAGVAVVDVQDQGGRLLSAVHPRVKVPSVMVNTIIVHRLAAPASFDVGDTVDLEIDWPNRYQTMRHHSASHFLFHAASEIIFGGESPPVRGCQIDSEGHRFDFAADVAPEQLPDVEARANELISSGGDILLEAEPQSPEIKYWRYGDGIIIPCGGTHVRSAAELGPISLRRRSKGKGLTRVSGAFA